jgi:hypothetical protein
MPLARIARTSLGATAAPSAAPPVAVGMATSPAFGGSVPVFAARLAGDARLGRYVWRRPIVTTVSFPPALPIDGVLGIHALRDFAVSLDQRTARARFARALDTVPSPPPLRGRGLAVRHGTGPLVVTAVIPGSTAAARGIQAGDVVLQANGRSTVGFTPAEWDPLASSVAPLRLMVERARVRRTVVVPSQLLVP